MKFVVSREALANALDTVQRVAPSKGTIPILSGVLLELLNSSLRLVCTDLELAIEMQLHGVSVNEEGATVVPVKVLADAVKHLNGEDVIFDLDGNTLVFHSGAAEFKLNTMPAEEFPAFPEVEGVRFKLLGEVFSKLLKETAFVVNKKEYRQVLTGVFFEVKDGILSAVATDTFRMAWSKAYVDDDGIKASAIIPIEAIQQVSSIVSKEFDIVIAEKQVAFVTPNIGLVTRVIEGQFPRYQAVLPDTEKRICIVKVGRRELIDALERVAVLGVQDRFISVRLRVEEQRILLSAEMPDLGKVYDEVSPEFAKGEIPFEIALRARYLLEGLKAIAEEKVVLEFTEPARPIIVRPEQNEEYLYLVMPLLEE